MTRNTMRRLRAANPVPAPTRPPDADALFARLVAQPGDARLTSLPTHRRPRRRRLRAARPLTAARRAMLLTAVAATAALVAVALDGAVRSTGSGPGNGYAVIDPNVAAILGRLAAGSAKDTPFTGRYVTLSESATYSDLPGQTERITSVYNTRTGAVQVYSTPLDLRGATPASRRDLTFQRLDALVDPQPFLYPGADASLPTDPTALRAKLLPIGVLVVSMQLGAPASQQAVLRQAILAAVNHGVLPLATFPRSAAAREEDVYAAASDLLWSPLVQPALRSALYKVLATTGGVSVNTQAIDPAGRPAIAMSRSYSTDGKQLRSTTYENPRTGGVLAQTVSEHGGAAPASVTSTAIYQPVISSDSAPANPYAN